MQKNNKTMKTDIILSGVGGQGILSIATVIGEAAMKENLYLKQAEVHGMSQRGGSIFSDLRFGSRVLSPMIPSGKVDILVSMQPEWSDVHKADLAEGGRVVSPADIDMEKLENPKSLNVALLGVLSKIFPDIPEEKWLEHIRKNFSEKLYEGNLRAFKLGRGEL